MIQTIKKYIGDDIFTKFCALYDKMVSLYHMMKSPEQYNISFEFVKKNDCYNFPRYTLENCKSCIDFYIRFEHLQEDLEKVCIKLKIKYDLSKLPKFKTDYREENDDYHIIMKNFVYIVKKN